jgi:hypothetical protein
VRVSKQLCPEVRSTQKLAAISHPQPQAPNVRDMIAPLPVSAVVASGPHICLVTFPCTPEAKATEAQMKTIFISQNVVWTPCKLWSQPVYHTYIKGRRRAYQPAGDARNVFDTQLFPETSFWLHVYQLRAGTPSSTTTLKTRNNTTTPHDGP